MKQVIDGDTLRLADGRKLRLLAVNAPERYPKSGVAEPYADTASRAVEALLGSERRILILTDREEKDRYGRLLAHVFLPDGTSLSARLLQEGLGWHLAIPPNMSFADCLAAVENAARLAGKGVWGLSPVAIPDIRKSGYQRVQGIVESVSLGKKKSWWVRFEGGLTAVIPEKNQPYFDRGWLEGIRGKRIEVGGWIVADKKTEGGWFVKLGTQFDLEPY